jgi:AAA ATPase domain
LLTLGQCSPYYQNTALYPWIELLERVALRFEREETPEQKLSKLQGFLVQYGLSLAEAVPLFAALLSLPLPAEYAPLTLAPEQQKQQLLYALLTILLRIAARQPVLFVMEDLHWVDPSTLEFLSLLIAQGPTARILALFTFRPDFSPPWTGRSHLAAPIKFEAESLPVKLVDRALLMGHEDLARALIELMQIGKTPSGADPVLHHPPKTFNGIEVVSASSRQELQPKLFMPVGQC